MAYTDSERKPKEGNRHNTLLWRIRTIGLKAIIEGCEKDLALLRRLSRLAIKTELDQK